jgi:glycosyltransferase involved in cell wall biosynthesis
MENKISICIPTWEQHGYGGQYLNHLLNSIKKQTYSNYNVVISDHSLDKSIKSCLDNHKDLEIIYIKNNTKLGNGPANTNNAIKYCDGNIIKVMFQDDFFFNNRALEIINKTFLNDSVKWVVNGCNHTTNGFDFTRPMIPAWNDDILYGNNTISSPSVLSFKNDDVEFFDENLVMLMDCDYYYRLFTKYGHPHILKEILITNRIHKNQISSTYSGNINDEINYVKQKYKL